MSMVNKSRTQTAFTVSIESKKGITTGISAYDRAKTIKVAIRESLHQKKILFLQATFFPGCKERWCFRKSWTYRSFLWTYQN